MHNWTLSDLLDGLHDDIQHRLTLARKSLAHPVAKGDASEGVWLELLQKYLPQRYQAAKAFVVDSKGSFSDQIDVVVFDRQYSPFIFEFEEQKIVPAESVYAVFEAKQEINAAMLAYAQSKAASVRQLHRTSLPIPHAGGTYPAKPPGPILAGILTLESAWSPPLGTTLLDALKKASAAERLDLGCVAACGTFQWREDTQSYLITKQNRPATSFLFELITRLQSTATVSMIDISAYAAWLAK